MSDHSDARAVIDQWRAAGWEPAREGWAWPEWKKQGRLPELMDHACVSVFWPDLAHLRPPFDDDMFRTSPPGGGAPC